MYPANRFVQAMVCLLSLIPVSAIAQYDANSLRAASSKNSSSYESGRSTGSRMGFTGPEGTGRPGIFFFKKGEKAFERDQYNFAVDMYEVAASWAYKPAQYNLSVMYSKGQGIPVDLPRAMAWLALAAERGEPRYVRARDAINITLDSDQVAEANRILDQLKPKYADKKAMRKAKRRWRDAKLDATGSRLGFTGGLKVTGAGQNIAGMSGNELTYPGAISGGKQNDASNEYRQLQESDGPYDSKDRELTGTVTVDALIIPDLSKAKAPVATPADDSAHH